LRSGDNSLRLSQLLTGWCLGIGQGSSQGDGWQGSKFSNKWMVVERNEGRLETCIGFVSTDMEMISKQEAKDE